MPTLKQISCTVEKAPDNIELKEYNSSYGDGFVESFVAIPDDPTAFSIHVTSSGYVAPGLAVFVFIDGVYQCNRNRNGLTLPQPALTPDHYEVDFRVRQKEEKLESGGKFLGRPWRFEKFNIATADAAPTVNPDVLGNIGTIEVVVLRCRAPDDEPQPHYDAPAHQPKIKDGKIYIPQECLGLPGLFDGAGDESDEENFGAAFDGPRDVRIRHHPDPDADDEVLPPHASSFARNSYGYDRAYDRARYEGRSRHRRADNSPLPPSDLGPIFDEFLRWRETHPEAAAHDHGREPRRDSGYYKQYRPAAVEDSTAPRPIDEAMRRGHRRQRYRPTQNYGTDPASRQAQQAHIPSNVTVDTDETSSFHTVPSYSAPFRRDHMEPGLRAMYERHRVPLPPQSDSTHGTSTEYEVTRRVRDAASGPERRPHLQSIIDPGNSSNGQGSPQVRHVHWADGYPDNNPFAGRKLADATNTSNQPLEATQLYRRPSYRRDGPDSSLASSMPAPDARYNPRYPPEAPFAPSGRHSYAPPAHASSKMPGGWSGMDPYESVSPQHATANPFEEWREVDTSRPDVHPGWTTEDHQRGSGSHQPRHSSQGSGKKASSAAKSNSSSHRTKTQGWNTAGLNDIAEVSGWGEGNKPTSGEAQGWGGNKDGHNAQSWGQDEGNQAGAWESVPQDAGDTTGGWNNNEAPGGAGNSGWDNSAPADNATTRGDAEATAWNNDDSHDQNQEGDNTGNQNSAWDNDGNQNGAWDNSGEHNGAWNNNTNQDTGHAWDAPVQPTPSHSQGKKSSPSHKPTKAGHKAGSITSSAFLHKPAVAEEPYVKSYWQRWNQPESQANPVGGPSRNVFIAPSEAPHVIPEETAKEKAIEHQVQAGKGWHYTHRTGKPVYIDDFEEPYAIFRFKYRSKDMLRKILGRRASEQINKDISVEKEEARKKRLQGLSKDELIEQLMRGKTETVAKAASAKDVSERVAPAKAASVKQPSPKAPSIRQPSVKAPSSKPPSIQQWVDDVVKAQTASSEEPMTCDRCSLILTGSWWHCDDCDDYDICQSCVSKGNRCKDKSHELTKWMDNQDIGNGVKAPGPTAEKLSGISKSASRTGGSKTGGSWNGAQPTGNPGVGWDASGAENTGWDAQANNTGVEGGWGTGF